MNTVLKNFLIALTSLFLLFSHHVNATDSKDVNKIYSQNLKRLKAVRNLTSVNELILLIGKLKNLPFDEVEEAINIRLYEEFIVDGDRYNFNPRYGVIAALLDALAEVGTSKSLPLIDEIHNFLSQFGIGAPEYKEYKIRSLLQKAEQTCSYREKLNPTFKGIVYNIFDEDYQKKSTKLLEHRPEFLDLKKFENDTKEALNKKIVGQPEVVEKIAEIMTRDQILHSRLSPEILYLMGAPGTGKDTSAEAMADVIHGKEGAHADHMYTIAQLSKEADLWSILGSPPGYIGSGDFPTFLEFVANHSGGRYLVKEEGKGKKSIHENPEWKGRNLHGYNRPQDAVVFLNEFHDWAKSNKNNLVKKAIEKGTFTINAPGGGVNEMHVPVTFVIATNEGLGLSTSREANGERFGRPLSYEESLKLWEINSKDYEKKSAALTSQNGSVNTSGGGVDAKGTSEELVNRVPQDRLLLMRPLSPESLQLITNIHLSKFAKEISNPNDNFKNLKITWDESILKFVQGFNYIAELNAREMKNKVKSLVEQTVFDAMKESKIKPNTDQSVSIHAVQEADQTWGLEFIVTEGKEEDKFKLPVRGTLDFAMVKPISDEEIDHLLRIGERMKKKVFGATHVIESLARAILISEEGRTAIRSIEDAKLPARSFMFLGPSSTGKTELAKVVAEELMGSRKELVTMDFSQVTSIEDIKDKILGKKDSLGNSIPSEFMKEYDRKGGKLVVVLDEVANALDSKNTLKALYDLLREPIVSTFSDGKERIMSNVTLIMTGNVGEEWYQGIPTTSPERQQRAARKQIYQSMMKDPQSTRETLENYFSEALINRVGERNIFFFPSLSYQSVRELTNLKISLALKELKPKDSARGWNIAFESTDDYKKIVEQLEEEAFSLKEQGASIDSFIKQIFSENLRATLLEEKIPSDSEIMLKMGTNGEETLNLKLFVKGRSEAISIDIRKKKSPDKLKVRDIDQIFTAYHEAGHTIVGQTFFGDLQTATHISIIPGVTKIGGQWTSYAGIAENRSELEPAITKELIQRKMAVLAGGYMAQNLTSKSSQMDAGRSNDMQRAKELAERAILEFGLSDEWGDNIVSPGQPIEGLKSNLSQNDLALLRKIVDQMLDEAELLAKNALLENYDFFIELGVNLAEKGDLDEKALRKFYKQHKLITEISFGEYPYSPAAKKAKVAVDGTWYTPFLPKKKNSRDAVLRKDVPRPSKIANIDNIIKAEMKAEIKNVDNYDLAPLVDNPEDFYPQPLKASAEKNCTSVIQDLILR